MSNFRKLAAIDIVLLGKRFVLAEYICGVVLPITLGILSLARGHSRLQSAMGAYLVCLGINYIPMIIYAIAMANHEKARAELGEELGQQHEAMARYRKLSLLLLVPLLVPAVALVKRNL